MTFVRGMIPHHAQAITMAQALRRRSGDRTLRSLALDIELGQQEQIRQMQGWLHLWNLPPVDPAAPLPAAHARMMGMASPAELNALNTRPVPEAETLFVQLMIRHHQERWSWRGPRWTAVYAHRCSCWRGRSRVRNAARSPH
ncbi:DUF305 domain-containing protein [Deinococcus aquaticus]|uniref:DUF305 domain-containing protein n=1 Tax=Deinococcus aquaticus TaxID=328692 RepID=UPI00360839AD